MKLIFFVIQTAGWWEVMNWTQSGLFTEVRFKKNDTRLQWGQKSVQKMHDRC